WFTFPQIAPCFKLIAVRRRYQLIANATIRAQLYYPKVRRSWRTLIDQQAKTSAWNQIAETLGKDATWCLKRFQGLKRDYFVFRRGSKLPSGSAVKPTPRRLGIYSRMNFLDKCDYIGDTTSNVPPPTPELVAVGSAGPSQQATSVNDEAQQSSRAEAQAATTDPSEASMREFAESAPKKARKATATEASKLDTALSQLTQQLTKDEDEYASFGQAIGQAIRRLPTQIERDYAMAHLRSELFTIQLHGLPRSVAIRTEPAADAAAGSVSFDDMLGSIISTARQHNMADVSAKDASQETLVNLVELVVNLTFVPLITGPVAVPVFIIFTSGHIFGNWCAVRSVAMETLNPSRLHLVVVSFVASGGRACSGVAEVNQSEPLLRSCAAPLRLGCPLSAPAAALPADRLVDGLRQQRHRRLAVFTGASSYYAVLAEDATSTDQLLAVFQCELIHLARTRPKLFDAIGGCSELRAGDAAAAATAERLMPDFLGALSKAGWSTEPLLLGAGQHRLTWSNEATEYVLTQQKLLIKGKKRKFDGFVSTAKDVFLPQGYPDSVSADYLTYQMWDTAQAFCSSVTGALAGRAVLTGYGVGDQGASVAAATLAWLLRDGCGMVGRILFAWLYGTALDWDCKRYRLLADVLNDLAILMQLLCPLAGPPGSPTVAAVLCVASVLLSLVGVCGGATRAALTMHQARRHNMADVSAKDSSQETLVNLFALLFNLAFVPLITGGAAVLAYLLFTFGHLYFNWRAVRSVAMETLNPSRLHLVVVSFVASGGRACSGVAEVNQSEPLLRSCAAPLRLGCPLSAPAAALPADRLVDGLRQQRHRRLAVFTGASSYYVVLAEDATSADQLL
uniref:MADF domain-containing protein n=1 Tax=Macrostomum lignano TaxID=282301 RepID=A0A1I8IX14_9PLAT